MWYDIITPEEGGIRIDADQRILMRCLARFKKNMGVFSRGYGKCIAGDSLLFTSDGMKEIGEFFSYLDSNEETFFSHDIQLLNKYGSLETSDKGVYSGYKPTKKIITEEGYEIEGTLIHPLLTMSKDGTLQWKKAKDIEIGDYLPINRENNVWGSKTKIDVDMRSWLNTFSSSSACKIKRVRCNIIDELDEDLALIMGYLLGDGGLTRNNRITFTTKDDDILKNFLSFMENRLEVKVVKVSDIDYVVNGMYTREFFSQLGLRQVDAFNKEIPSVILESPKHIVASFIRGLFDTDGGLSDSYIEFCTTSEKLSKQLQLVLLNFGIISTRVKKYNKKFNTYSYRICIYSKSMDVFLKEIGFGCSRKQQRLIELCSVKRNPNKDIIPNQTKLLKRYYNDAKQYNRGLFKVFGHVLRGENQLTYGRLHRVLNINNSKKCDGYDELLELSNLNYFYSRVKTIEDGENHVYDLQVPSSNSFIGNGFVNHNTMIQLMCNYHASIFYPNIEIAMTAQTRENAANLVGEKFREIERFYPMIKDELSRDPRIGKDKAIVDFKSGGKHNCHPMVVIP